MELNHIKENIDLFIQGKLQGADLSAMENLLKSDAKIASEVELQKMITQSIQTQRKIELKARLDNIPVPSVHVNPGQMVTRLTAIRAASVIVASASLSIGAYLYFRQDSDTISEVNTTEVPVKAEEKIALEEMPIVSQENEDASTEQSAIVNSPVANSGSKATSEALEKTEKTIAIKKTKDETARRDFLDSKFESENESAVKTDIKEAKEIVATKEATKASDVDIKNIQDGEHNFHYMMKESVLYLYGNFDASPYEILEFNDKDGQALYLYYDNSYFVLKSSQAEIRKLKRINDEKLISELSEARSKKR